MDNVPEHPGRNFGLVPVVGNRIMDFPAINVGMIDHTVASLPACHVNEKPAIIRTETTNNVCIFPSPHSRSMLGGDRLERFRPWFREGDVPGSQMWQRAFPMGELALQRLSFGIRIHGEILGFRRDEDRV